MKRNTLTAAVLAGMTGVAGMVNVSHAVNLNPDGLGQVLLYPYYTARGGNDTLISVVNTTSDAKAVKVRFLEALNSREVLDFNLYLSPFDVWTSFISLDEETGRGVMSTEDTSCTVPYFVGNSSDGIGRQEFLTFQYTGDNFDAGPQTAERTASGYLEIIEMGSLQEGDNVFFDAIKHVNGVPRSGPGFGNPCDLVVGAWQNGGTWDSDNTVGLEPATGGLFGSASIINVNEGTLLPYDATAIDGFWGAEQIAHTNPGFVTPNLNSSNNTTSNVFNNGVVETADWDFGVQAVNATIMFDQLMNEYNVQSGIGARSEWVVTFPTKGFHTDTAFGGNIIAGVEPIQPFTDIWGLNSDFSLSAACESLDIDFWDREESTEQQGLVVSPPPPVQGFQLCREANVIRFAESGGVPSETEILKEPQRDNRNLTFTNFQLPSGFNSGWLQFNFGEIPSSAGGGVRVATAQDGTEYRGLPVIGFWAQRFSNGTLVDDTGASVLSNYAGTFDHKGSRKIQ